MTTGTCQTVCPGSAVATDGGPISTPSVATRQMELFRAIRATWPSGAFNNDMASLETLRGIMGWKTRGAVTVALHALRAKGVLDSEGRSKARPVRWVWKLEEVAA